MDQLIAQDPSMKDKKNPLGLSEKLMIDQEEFEDLDEIIARYISPLMGNVEDLKRHKYYWVWVGLDFFILFKKIKHNQPPRSLPYY